MRVFCRGPYSTAAGWLLILLCYLSVSAAERGLLQQESTDLQQPDGTLLKSMHCFNRQTAVWLASTDWKASSDFLVRCRSERAVAAGTSAHTYLRTSL